MDIIRTFHFTMIAESEKNYQSRNQVRDLGERSASHLDVTIITGAIGHLGVDKYLSIVV